MGSTISYISSEELDMFQPRYKETKETKKTTAAEPPEPEVKKHRGN